MNPSRRPSPAPGRTSGTMVHPGRSPGRQEYIAAACLTLDMDAEAAVLTADISSMSRMTPMSRRVLRPAGGRARILALLKRHGVTATFFIPGYSAHRYPDVVRAVAEAGREIAHRSYCHENTIGMDEKTEAAMIDLGLRALHDVAGVRPQGYRAPMWEMNFHTPKLRPSAGSRWDSSLMDSDHPYVLAVDGAAPGSLVEVPVWWGLDDWEQYAFLPGLIGSGVIGSPAKALEMWTLELDAMHRLGGALVFVLPPVPVRPAISGRGPGSAHRADESARRALDHHRGGGGPAHGVAEPGPADLSAAGHPGGCLLGRTPAHP